MADMERAVRCSTDGRNLASERPLPILWASLFLAYLLTAFALMSATRLLPEAEVFSAFGYHVSAASLHDVFFKYSVIGLGVVPAVFLIEMLSVGWAGSSLRALCRPDNLS